MYYLEKFAELIKVSSTTEHQSAGIYPWKWQNTMKAQIKYNLQKTPVSSNCLVAPQAEPKKAGKRFHRKTFSSENIRSLFHPISLFKATLTNLSLETETSRMTQKIIGRNKIYRYISKLCKLLTEP